MAKPITVLIVDEDQDILDIAATFLKRADESLDVSVARDPNEALERLDDTQVDCVISDYSMPGMTGVDFLQAVRDRNPDLPFFFFTGRSRSQIEAELDEQSITGYIKKGTGTDQYGVLAESIREAVTGNDR